MDKISVAVPCYNEEPALEPFFAAVSAVAEQMPEVAFEFLFIDDGSRDRTLEKMQELAQRDSRVKYISFSRNFGKEAGIYAGLENATDKILYVGDSNVDVQTAHNAGLPCCGVLWGFRTREELEQEGAEYLAADCKELEEIILR